jgi:hypothetical protein
MMPRHLDGAARALARLIARKLGHDRHWWRATEGLLSFAEAARLLQVTEERLEELVQAEASEAVR